MLLPTVTRRKVPPTRTSRSTQSLDGSRMGRLEGERERGTEREREKEREREGGA